MSLPVYDNASSVTFNGLASATIPAFAVAGENRLIFVGAGTQGGGFTVSSVVRNGAETFTAVPSFTRDSTGGNHFRVSGYTFVAPAVGTYSIVVTFSNALLGHTGAVSVTGAHQTVPLGTAVSATSSADDLPTLTCSAADDELLLDQLIAWAATATAGAGQTERYKRNAVDITSGGCSEQPGTVAGNVMSWTLTSGGQEWSMAAVPIKPAAGGITVTQTSVISAAASVLTHAAATLYPGSVIPTITL